METSYGTLNYEHTFKHMKTHFLKSALVPVLPRTHTVLHTAQEAEHPIVEMFWGFFGHSQLKCILKQARMKH